MSIKKYKITALAVLLSAVCLTGCSQNNNSENSVSDNNTSIIDDTTDNTETENSPSDSEISKPDTEKTEETVSSPDNSENIFTERDLCLTPDLTDAVEINAEDNSNYTINSKGVYYLTGKADNFTVTVDADKSDKVQIVTENAEITNESFPVIYVKSADKCFISPLGENSFSVNREFTSDGDTNTDAVIYSKDDLVLNGTGTLNISSPYGNGISGKDDFKATGGTYNIECKLDGIEVNDSISVCGGEFSITSDKDAIHCENSNDDTLGSVYIENGTFNLSAKSDGIQTTSYMVINDGTFNITSAEGLESTYIQINGGDIYIEASDDGINASRKSSAFDVLIEFNGGNTTIIMGAGDTDGIDANGSIIVNSGTIDVTGNSTFDYDVSAEYNGGTIIVNGTQVDEIPQSMMGGFGGGHRGGFGDNNFNGEGKPPFEDGDFDGERKPPFENGDFDGERKPPFEDGDFDGNRKPPFEDGDFDGERKHPFENGNFGGKNKGKFE